MEIIALSQVNYTGGGRVSLAEGQRVTFEVGEGQKGPQAERNTTLISV